MAEYSVGFVRLTKALMIRLVALVSKICRSKTLGRKEWPIVWWPPPPLLPLPPPEMARKKEKGSLSQHPLAGSHCKMFHNGWKILHTLNGHLALSRNAPNNHLPQRSRQLNIHRSFDLHHHAPPAEDERLDDIGEDVVVGNM